jgi:hypothetical protein
MGFESNASGTVSTSMGSNTTASGSYSTSMGSGTTASGNYSTSMGTVTTASGDYSTSMGYYTTARAFRSVALGMYNDSIASSNTASVIQTDPLFMIGNGISDAARKNALMVLKNGRTGINTNTPLARLHIVGDGTSGATSSQVTANTTMIVEDNGINYIQLFNPVGSAAGILSGTDISSNRSALLFNADSSVSIRAGGGLVRLFVDNNGNTGVGTTTPSQKLHVIGNILASGTITPSDIRYKKDIEQIEQPLEKIDEIRGVTYKLKTDEFPESGFTEETQAGVIAQEVEAVLPEVVVTNKDGYKGVDYSKMVPLLIEGIKELKKQNEEQQKKIDQQDAINKMLIKKIEKLEKK